MNQPPLDPGKSTVYVANLPYNLSKADVENVFCQYGEIVKVTLLTVKETRKSKGVAFVLFRYVEDATHCVQQANNSMVEGQTIRASIARDNGQRPNLVKNPVYKSQRSQETQNFATAYNPYS